MTEFNSAAFAAVDSFFVTTENTTGTQRSPDHGEKAPSKNRRLGVGAAPAAAIQPSGNNHAKMMQVGRRKKKRHRDDEGSDVENHKEDDDDDEGELGRTGIVASNNKAKASDNEAGAAIQSQQKKKKKKKSGKKERQKEKEQSAAMMNEEKEESGDLDNRSPNAHNNDITAPEADQTIIKEREEEEKDTKKSNKPKRKRRKVRSRQKNIYKDNRRADERPDFLVPGGFEYKGRPMTAATRAKLVAKGLMNVVPVAESSTEQGLRSHWDEEKGEKDHNPHLQQPHDSGVPLAHNNNKSVAAAKSHTRKNKPKPKKKNRKTKYKNVQVLGQSRYNM